MFLVLNLNPESGLMKLWFFVPIRKGCFSLWAGVPQARAPGWARGAQVDVSPHSLFQPGALHLA